MLGILNRTQRKTLDDMVMKIIGYDPTLRREWAETRLQQIKRNGEDLSYKGEEFYDENFDRYLLEWTGRFPLRYPEQESIPEEVTIKEWVISYFKAVSEGRQGF